MNWKMEFYVPLTFLYLNRYHLVLFDITILSMLILGLLGFMKEWNQQATDPKTPKEKNIHHLENIVKGAVLIEWILLVLQFLLLVCLPPSMNGHDLAIMNGITILHSVLMVLIHFVRIATIFLVISYLLFAMINAKDSFKPSLLIGWSLTFFFLLSLNAFPFFYMMFPPRSSPLQIHDAFYRIRSLVMDQYRNKTEHDAEIRVILDDLYEKVGDDPLVEDQWKHSLKNNIQQAYYHRLVQRQQQQLEQEEE